MQQPLTDLRDWLSAVAEMGELSVIEGADWDLEIGCVSALNAQQKDPCAIKTFSWYYGSGT